MTVLRAGEAGERDRIGRGVGVVLLVRVALIHLVDAVNKVDQHKYVFVLYLVLMAGSLAVAAFLLRTDSRLAWSLVTLMTGLTVFGYILSRTTGLPKLNDDIGNETEPLGLASLSTEGVAVVLGAYKIATTPPVERGGLTVAIAGPDPEPMGTGLTPQSRSAPGERGRQRTVRVSVIHNVETAHTPVSAIPSSDIFDPEEQPS